MCAISYISMFFGLTNRHSQIDHRIYCKNLQKSLKIAISRSKLKNKIKNKKSHFWELQQRSLILYEYELKSKKNKTKNKIKNDNHELTTTQLYHVTIVPCLL